MTELVERDTESATAARLLDDLRHGRSALLRLRALPGVGRTAMLDQIAVLAEDRGIRVARAEIGPGTSLPLAVQLLGSEAQPTLAPLLDAAPLAVLIDDVQWLDETDLHQLGALVRRLHEAPVLLVFTVCGLCTSMDITMTGFAQYDAGAARCATHALALAPLSRGGVARLVGPALADTLFTSTGGVPALIHAVLARAGAAPTAADIERLADDAAQRALDTRIRTLPADSLRLLRCLAVTHGHAPPDFTALLAAPVTEATLIPLGAMGLLTRDTRLTGQDVADRVLASMTARERAELTTAAAELGHRCALPVEDVAWLLLHTPPLGKPWVVQALRDGARVAGDRALAVRLLDRALREPGQRGRLLLDAGHAETLVCPEAADRRLVQVLTAGGPECVAAADSLLARGDHGPVSRALRTRYRRAPDDRLLALYWSADEARQDDPELNLDQLPTVPDEPADPDLAGVAAWQAALAGQDRELTRRLARLALARPVGRDTPLTTRTRAARALVLTEDFAEAFTAFDEIVLTARRRDACAVAAWALLLQAEAHVRTAALDDALTCLDRALTTLPPRCWHPAVWPMCQAVRVLRHVAGDRADLARETAAPDPGGTGLSWLYWTFAHALLRLRSGDAAGAAPLFVDCGRRLTARGWHNPALLRWRSLGGTALHACGRHEEATRMIDAEARRARQWSDRATRT